MENAVAARTRTAKGAGAAFTAGCMGRLKPGRLSLRGPSQVKPDYFDAGVRLVWFVDPRRRIAEVFTGKKSSTILCEHVTLTGGRVLRGFSLPLNELFAELDESPPPARKKRSR